MNDASILGWMCIKQRSLSPFWIPPGSWLMKRFSKPKQVASRITSEWPTTRELALLGLFTARGWSGTP